MKRIAVLLMFALLSSSSAAGLMGTKNSFIESSVCKTFACKNTGTYTKDNPDKGIYVRDGGGKVYTYIVSYKSVKLPMKVGRDGSGKVISVSMNLEDADYDSSLELKQVFTKTLIAATGKNADFAESAFMLWTEKLYKGDGARLDFGTFRLFVLGEEVSVIG